MPVVGEFDVVGEVDVVEGDDAEVPEDVEAAEFELPPPPPQAAIKANRHEAAEIMRNLRIVESFIEYPSS